MTASPEFSLSEAGREQLQALLTLSALGWRYVTRAEADRQRGHRRTAVLLEDILRTQLRSLNRIRWNGRNHPFSEGNTETAIERLRDVRFDGLLRTNERQTDLLQLRSRYRKQSRGSRANGRSATSTGRTCARTPST